MFLNFLQTDGEKEVFIKMAIVVAIANIEVEKENANKNANKNAEMKGSSFRNYYLYNFLNINLTISENTDWKMSSLEKNIINGFLKELEFESYHVSTTEFEKIIEDLSPVLSKIMRLSEEERRLEIIENLIKDAIPWDEVENISPKSSRAMMIELISVALVDDDYAQLEKVVIKSIANKLKIDSDELEEMEKFVRSMKEIYKTGLEIINN